jgi:quercetin dioxygenase-like cupin family protein
VGITLENAHARRTLMETSPQQPIIVPAGEGTRLSVLGEIMTCKVTSGDTHRAYAVVEVVTPPQGGPPLHLHHHEDEMFYLLEGECEVQCGDQTFTATTGALVILPRKIPHRFRNIGTTPSKILVTITPGGFERFFEEVSRLPRDQPPEMDKIMAIAQHYHLELLPPSPGG